MDKITALQSFVRVVDSGSFSQAARELGVGQPAVSKQIAALEQRLGVRLLNRTSRGLRPTPSGTDLYESAVRFLSDLDDLESRITHGHGRPTGPVRIAAPSTLTSMMLVPKLPELYAEFPGLTVEFAVSERYADLVQDGLDMALRVGHLDDSSLVARRIGKVKIVTVASPGYLAVHGIPERPSDLGKHRLIASRYRGVSGRWHFRDGDDQVEFPVSGFFSSNDPADIHSAALAGLGIAQSARGLFDPQLRSGQLVEILKDFAPTALPLSLIYAHVRTPHRVRVVSDFIIKTIDGIDSLRNE